MYKSAFTSTAFALSLALATAAPALAQEAQDGVRPEIGPSATLEQPFSGALSAPGLGVGEWAGNDTEGGMDVPLMARNEPAVAVNPLDDDNVVVAGLFSLQVSIDGGETFGPEVPAPVPAGCSRAGDPSLAFDSTGSLFWTYLGVCSPGFLLDVYISQVDPLTGAIFPGYPVNVSAGAGVPGTATVLNDKQWLAADRFDDSPFQDRLYMVWSEFFMGGTRIRATFSADQGLTWSPALDLGESGDFTEGLPEGFVWPSHNAVAGNGDVYVAYHSQPGFAGGAPNGTTGRVFVLRSTDGGVSYPQKTQAFLPGAADITFNVQFPVIRTLPGSSSWHQGSAQPWVLPDPSNPSNVYVVAADDPTNTAHGGPNDDMDVMIVRSTTSGVTWGAPARVDLGPGATRVSFPTAYIAGERFEHDDGEIEPGDDKSLIVMWYDNRAGATNAAGTFLLDVFVRASFDGGITFGPEGQINDTPFDPDIAAPVRFDTMPPTTRIGEYNGISLEEEEGEDFHAAWTGNSQTLTGATQRIFYDTGEVEHDDDDKDKDDDDEEDDD